MKTLGLFTIFLFSFTPSVFSGQNGFQKDTIKTSSGDLEITFIGHGTLVLTHGGKVIHIDPWTRLADYSKLPKADIILVTHEHQDHLDPAAIESIRTDKTDLVINEGCSAKIKGGHIMKNGDETTIQGLKIKAVPAYNIVHKRSPGATPIIRRA